MRELLKQHSIIGLYSHLLSYYIHHKALCSKEEGDMGSIFAVFSSLVSVSGLVGNDTLRGKFPF